MIARNLSLLALPLLAGCASDGGDRFPSLAPRAAETRGFEEPAAPPPAAIRPDPALDARIAAVSAQAGERMRTFKTARAAAAAKVSGAGAAGSEAWLNAQVALGELDVARAAAGEDVTTLEQLAADRAVAGEPPYPALDAALAEARARQDAVGAAIGELNGKLSR